MKLVIAIIKPFKLDEVRDALTAHRRARHDRHRGQGLRPPEGPHRNLSRRRIRRELPAQDARSRSRSPTTQADKVVEAIGAAAKTGQIGDGKIFVYDLDRAVRIRTGETDNDAL